MGNSLEIPFLCNYQFPKAYQASGNSTQPEFPKKLFPHKLSSIHPSSASLPCFHVLVLMLLLSPWVPVQLLPTPWSQIWKNKRKKCQYWLLQG